MSIVAGVRAWMAQSAWTKMAGKLLLVFGGLVALAAVGAGGFRSVLARTV